MIVGVNVGRGVQVGSSQRGIVAVGVGEKLGSKVCGMVGISVCVRVAVGEEVGGSVFKAACVMDTVGEWTGIEVKNKDGDSIGDTFKGVVINPEHAAPTPATKAKANHNKRRCLNLFITII